MEHLVDVADHAEVYIFVAISGVDVFVANRRRFNVWVTAELRGAEVEGKEVVVVERPHAVRPCRLQHVLPLNLPHQRQIC